MMPPYDLARGDEEIVRMLFAPFTRVEPVLLRRDSPPQWKKRRALIVALAAACTMLVLGGLALAGAFGPLHGATLAPAPPSLSPATDGVACRLVGGNAATAAASLTKQGFQIEWRYQRWGTQAVTTADSDKAGVVAGGYTSAPATVPDDSVVTQIVADQDVSTRLFVFVEEPNDPDAPTLVRPQCSGS